MSDTTPQLFGWAAPENPGLLEEAFNIFGSSIKQMPIFVDKPKRSMLWELARQLLGNDIPNIPQQIGSCVAFGHGHGAELLQVYKLKNSDKNRWRKVHPSYIYGTSRVNIGGGRLGNSDGSIGIWAVQAMMKYGILFEDIPGVPKYTGALSKQWGRSGVPKEWMDEASKYLLKVTLDAAKVTTWEQLTSALANGYPVTVCSNQGFTMKPQSTGFHETEGQWPHCMLIDGYDETDPDPNNHAVSIMNSWGCYSDDTEILTEFGWFNFKDLPKNIKVATLNPETHELEYHLPTNYFEYDYNGEMYNFIGRDIDLLVTPNHKMYYAPIPRKDMEIKWKLDEAQNLIKTFKMKKNANWQGIEQEYYEFDGHKVKMDVWLEFLGYFISEGYINKSKRYYLNKNQKKISNGAGYRIGICQQKEYNIPVIEQCLSQLGFRFHKNKVGFIISNKKLYKELESLGKAFDKHIPDYVKNLSSRQLKILYNALMLGDGSYSKGQTGEKVTYYTSSPKLADDFQELLLKIGYAGDITSTNRIGRKATNGITRFIEYRVGIKRHEVEPIKTGGWIPILIPYNEKVYCVEVPNHIVYVRRNGRACWSGNSVHGQIIDPTTNTNWPIGHIRARRKVVERMLLSDGGDSWSLSDMDLGFVPRLPESAFSIF